MSTPNKPPRDGFLSALRHFNWRFAGAGLLVAALIVVPPLAGGVAAACFAASAGVPLGAAFVCGLLGAVATGALSPFTRGVFTKGRAPRNSSVTAAPKAQAATPADDATPAPKLAPGAAPAFDKAKDASAPTSNDNATQAPAADKKTAPPGP